MSKRVSTLLAKFAKVDKMTTKAKLKSTCATSA